MDNYINSGRSLKYTASAAISSGDPVLVGVMLGVAVADIANGDDGALNLEGVYSLPKATGAITLGAQVYWDADGDPVGGTEGSGALTTTSTDNTAVGKCMAAAASGDATVQIKINV